MTRRKDQSTQVVADARRKELRARLDQGADRTALKVEFAARWSVPASRVLRYLRDVDGYLNKHSRPVPIRERIPDVRPMLERGDCSMDIARAMKARWGVSDSRTWVLLRKIRAEIGRQRAAENLPPLPRRSARGRNTHAFREARIARVEAWLKRRMKVSDAIALAAREWGVSKHWAGRYVLAAWRRTKPYRDRRIKALIDKRHREWDRRFRASWLTQFGEPFDPGELHE